MTTQQLWPWHMWKIRTSISGGKIEWDTAITSFHGIGWGEEVMGQQCSASFREAGIYHLPCLLKSQVIFSKQIIFPVREEMMLKERYHHMDRMFFATLEAGWQWCLSDSPQPDFQQQVHKLLSQFLSIQWNHWFLPAVQKNHWLLPSCKTLCQVLWPGPRTDLTTIDYAWGSGSEQMLQVGSRHLDRYQILWHKDICMCSQWWHPIQGLPGTL